MRHATALAVACLLAAPAPAGADAALAPFLMVRSLQIVQDQLARGDHASLPMQKKLLELTDERFRTSTEADYADRRNFSALLVYSMSGGNPTTLEVVLSRLSLQGDELNLSRGVLAYMKGELARASQLLAPFDPLAADPETGAFLALLKGSVLAPVQPRVAIGLMDQARLLAPGTLVEEAALRRTLPMCIAVKDAACMMRAADRYTRRFLRSPYASEFADSFVEGVISFHDAIGPELIEGIVGLMNPAQQEAIYLRLARRSTIKGQTDRSGFASRKAQQLGRKENQAEDPRAALYVLISSITSENIAEVEEKLSAIDPSTLSPRDRRLLAAARAIAGEVLAPPATSPAPQVQLAPAAAEEPDTAAGDEPGQDAAEGTVAGPAAPAGPAFPAGEPQVPYDEASRKLADSVRSKLQDIDRLLAEEAKTQ